MWKIMGKHMSVRVPTSFKFLPKPNPQVEKGIRKRCKLRLNPEHRNKTRMVFHVKIIRLNDSMEYLHG